jgi:hypothetical protein
MDEARVLRARGVAPTAAQFSEKRPVASTIGTPGDSVKKPDAAARTEHQERLPGDALEVILRCGDRPIRCWSRGYHLGSVSKVFKRN